MRDYLVTLVSGQQYRFAAEDAAHARDQAENAEPDNPVVSVGPYTETQRLYDEHAAGTTALHEGDNYVDGCLTCHPPEDGYAALGWNIALAESRGYDSAAHFAALLSEDEDSIALTHPTNWLTEEEVEHERN